MQRKRGDTWQYTIELQRHGDKRRNIRKGGFPTKKAAAEAEIKHRMQLGQGLSPDADKLTVADYMQSWLDGKEISPTTMVRYLGVYTRYIEPVIGGVLLQKLRPIDIKACYSKIAAPSMRRSAHTNLLWPALNEAVKLELLGRNPAGAVDTPKAAEQDHREFPGIADVQRVLAEGDKTRWGPLFRLAVLTGLRKGELLGLKWEDVQGSSLSVKRQAVRWSGHPMTLTKPKTKRSIRTIPLGIEAQQVLAAHRRQQAEHIMAERLDYKDQGLVFAGPLGGVANDMPMFGCWQKVAEGAGLPGMKFHGLRHAFATLMLRAGVSMKVVSEMMGHASITITANLYSHVLPDLKHEAMAALESLLQTEHIGAQSASS